MPQLKIILSEVTDIFSQENFRQLLASWNSNPLALGNWVLREYSFTNNVSLRAIPHGLSFTPKDIIITSGYGTGNFTVSYGQTDSTYIYVNTTGTSASDPYRVRLLIGTLGTLTT